MNSTTVSLWALGIVAVVAIVFIIRYGLGGKIKLKGLGVSLEAEGKNTASAETTRPGAVVTQAKAGGNIRVENQAGSGVEASRVQAQGDITAINSPPPSPKK